MLKAGLLEMFFPLRKVLGPQRKMVSAMVRENRLRAIADQMQLLVFPKAKPRARKIECRSRYRLQLQYLAIKSDTSPPCL